MKKKCPVCKTEFNTAGTQGGQNRIYCFSCLPYGLSRKERKTIGRVLTQQRVSDYKLSIGCQLCGYKKCPKALEFHHVFAEEKANEPSLVARGSWENFLLEANKCILLCANCHREEQSGLIDNDKIINIYNQKS